ncbi:TolC family protein [Nitrospirillum sp. BR 11163]|uniref:TolC family protein n=1 Tax=Nitrospirillum sp. BR 11163 TaxID=3104323 RepID=UPI002AFF7D78|nr:TolC family protein [Nitrospirillum sp. BR 11163]MEA1673347.1 TolC family protein [Nitrospirillum sp. BR 11163]
MTSLPYSAPVRRTRPRTVATPIVAGALVALLAGCSVAPRPLTPEENQTRANEALKLVRDRVDPVTVAVSLDEAIARAIKYNLDHRLALMDQAIANRQIDVSRWDLLPKLVVDGGLTARSNELASSSYSILTGKQSLEPSISSDRRSGTADLQLSWSVLDFGISYYQARQNGDRALATAEKRRSAVNSIVQQVRAAYWQAVAAEKIGDRINPILADARLALEDTRKGEQQRLRPLLDALRDEKSTIDIIRQLENLQADLALAKTQLAALMGLPPGTQYQLVLPDNPSALPEMKTAVAELEHTALINRPELREQAYNRRIATDEVHKAFLKLFPNLSIQGGLDYDSNSFLTNQRWAEGGLRLSWGLLNLLSGNDFMGLAETQRDQTEVRNLALSMAVMTQVNVAWQQLGRARTQYLEAAELDSIEGRIYDQVVAQSENNAASKVDRVRAQASRIVAELTRARAYADMQNALASLYVSVGIDPLPQSVPDYSLKTLTTAISAVNRRIESGMFGAEASVSAEAPILDDPGKALTQ